MFKWYQYRLITSFWAPGFQIQFFCHLVKTSFYQQIKSKQLSGNKTNGFQYNYQ